MNKLKKRITRMDGSCLMGHESSNYSENMAITFTKLTNTEQQTVVISLDLYDLGQLMGRIHQHKSAQISKLEKLNKAIRGEQ